MKLRRNIRIAYSLRTKKMSKGINEFEKRKIAFEQSFLELDVAQRAPIESAAPCIVVKAAPGSGKTKILISAICLYRYNNLNDNICAITFTRAAAAEMQERLEKYGVNNVQISTIHS